MVFYTSYVTPVVANSVRIIDCQMSQIRAYRNERARGERDAESSHIWERTSIAEPAESKPVFAVGHGIRKDLKGGQIR
jgi:hypothetical protein